MEVIKEVIDNYVYLKTKVLYNFREDTDWNTGLREIGECEDWRVFQPSAVPQEIGDVTHETFLYSGFKHFKNCRYISGYGYAMAFNLSANIWINKQMH